MKNPMNIAVIGCGDVAVTHHIPTILKSDDFKLSALCDVNEEALTRLGEKYSVAVCSDYRAILSDASIPAVIIATPPWITPQIVCDSLMADKYILSEKPMALSLAEAKKIKAVQSGRPNKSLFQMGFTYRHDPLIKQLRQWITDGKLGHPLVFRLGIFDEIWDPEGNPEHYDRLFKTLQHGCPTIHDGAHAADYLNFLSGSNVASIQAVGLKSRPEFHASNFDLSTVIFKNGDMAKLEIGWFYPALPYGEFEVLGPLGYASYDYHKRRLTLHSKSGDAVVSDSESWWEASFKNQLAAFAQSIRSGTPFSPGIDDGIFSLDLCKKIEHCIKENPHTNYAFQKENQHD